MASHEFTKCATSNVARACQARQARLLPTGIGSKLDFVHLSRVADGFSQAIEQGARYFHHIALAARPIVNPFSP
jgi:hypothetical protein